jgi:light-regulated signal transduction histidine kinase (bacteriophytochrome)
LIAKDQYENQGQEEQLKIQLESVTDELEAFAYSVSHDLRAPVRHIHSFARLIQDRSSGVLDEKSTLYLQNILASAEKMSQLIDDLLSYSGVAKSPLRQIRFKLEDLVNEIITEDFILETQNRAIHWNIEELGEIHSDPVLLRQVFTNLISNSLKFTKPVKKPEISIGRINEPGSTVLFVKDNGVGFNNKYADRAFDVFYRLHQEGDFEGSGIGLSIVRRIIARCGGQVRAEGKINAGATIFIYFPAEIMP